MSSKSLTLIEKTIENKVDYRFRQIWGFIAESFKNNNTKKEDRDLANILFDCDINQAIVLFTNQNEERIKQKLREFYFLNLLEDFKRIESLSNIKEILEEIKNNEVQEWNY